MAKKFKKSTKSLLNILLVILVLSLFLFGVVFFKTNTGNSDVKGDSTSSIMPMIKRDGVAGEACGKSINRACQKNLICAPLGPSYRIRAMKATEVETMTENEMATSEEVVNVGKTEDEIKDGRPPYIPYYGACVKKGVWPPTIKPTPIPNTGCVLPPKPCDSKTQRCPQLSPLPPGTIVCTPTPTLTVSLTPMITPTPSTVTCGWCGDSCVDTTLRGVCIMIAPPEGYLCVNKENVCTKVEQGVVVRKTPTPSLPPIQKAIKNVLKGLMHNAND